MYGHNDNDPREHERDPNLGVAQSFSLQPPAEAERKKRKKPFRTGGIVAIALCCALAGGVAGGAAVGGYMKGEIDALAATINTQTPQISGTPLVTTPGSTSGLTPTQIYAQYADSCVAIATEATAYNVFGQPVSQASAGSGFIISSDGYIVTNAHVIDGSSTIQVVLANGDSYDATVVGKDTQTDIAVLKINATNLSPVSFGDSDSINVGESLVAIGNPLGELNNSLTSGVLSARDREVNIDGTPMNMLQFDASVSPGNSGGPLFNSRGEVIGIVSAKSSGSGVEGIGFAIPSNDAQTVIEQLMNHGYVKGRPYLGLSVDLVNAQMAAYYQMEQGVYVFEVEEGSCAAEAGIQVGDAILNFNGTDITSSSDMRTILQELSAGDNVTMTVKRDGRTMTLNITLDEKVDTQDTDTGNPGSLFPSRVS